MSTSKQMFSTVSSDGQLTVEIKQVDVPEPKEHEVVVKIEVAPINPSDMWPMFSVGDLSKAELTYNDDVKAMTAPLFPGMTQVVRTRLDQACPVGNEASGIVVAAGSSDASQALMGKRVAVLSGSGTSTCLISTVSWPSEETVENICLEVLI